MHTDRAARHVAMAALALVLTSLTVLAPPLVAQGGPNHLRMLLASGVACRAEPSVDAPVERRYLVGDVFYATGRADDGEATWYLDASRARGGSRGCWLYGPLTIEYDRGNPEPALLAAAERILSREEDVSFVEWVAVENLLLSASGSHDGGSPREASPLLELRRLQIIEGAVRAAPTAGPPPATPSPWPGCSPTPTPMSSVPSSPPAAGCW